MMTTVKRLCTVLMFAASLAFACAAAQRNDSIAVSERPKLMWIDLSANWKTFSSPAVPTL